MLASRLLLRHAVSAFRKGGFTLVELLVVIGIIAILAGVALGPITSGIKKAQQNSAVQQEHAIGLAMFAFANDNNQLYPDTSNPNPNGGAANAPKVAWALLSGNYVSDPVQFWISGGTATKYTGTPATSIAQNNVSFDFAGNSGAGLSTTAYPYLPLFWNSIGLTSFPSVSVGQPIIFSPTAGSAFQTAGMAVFYCNESAAYVTANSGTCTVVQGASVTGSFSPTVLPGGD